MILLINCYSPELNKWEPASGPRHYATVDGATTTLLFILQNIKHEVTSRGQDKSQQSLEEGSVAVSVDGRRLVP